MNNKEKEGIKVIKESGLVYQIKYNYSPYSGGYEVAIPALCSQYSLQQSELFQRDLKRYRESNTMEFTDLNHLLHG